MSSDSLTIEDYKKIVQSLLSAERALGKTLPVTISASPKKAIAFRSAMTQLSATAALARKLTDGNAVE
jgi:hypothetical protein